MLIRLGEKELFLDKSGACVVPSSSLLIINGVAWNQSGRELFPDFGPTNQTKELIARLVSDFRTSSVVFVGRSSPECPESLGEFVAGLGLESFWVGYDPVTSPSDANICDEILFDRLSIGIRHYLTPAIVGGFAPGDSGGKCFLLHGENLILPSQSEHERKIPDFIAPKCDAYWLGRNGIIKGHFEALNHSLR